MDPACTGYMTLFGALVNQNEIAFREPVKGLGVRARFYPRRGRTSVAFREETNKLLPRTRRGNPQYADTGHLPVYYLFSYFLILKNLHFNGGVYTYNTHYSRNNVCI